MTRSVFIVTPTHRYACTVIVKNHKVTLDLSAVAEMKLQSFDLEIVFKNSISTFRNHDYSWVKCDRDRIAGEFSPKILKLDNSCFVQPDKTLGIWEIQKRNPRQLLWRFNPQNAAPLTTYTGNENKKRTGHANIDFFPVSVSLLFSARNAVEFSRSPLDFSAIACFTDHCDFDTPENLRLQREFFKANSIKVTKGFFLNHYSKRTENASFENNAHELQQWKNDSHELAYHSLSQSIKTDVASFDDFKNFSPPFLDLPTWIDHGYQPYNFSLFQSNHIAADVYEANLKEKNITTLWNYIDSGTATSGVINQLNPEDFTLKSFYNGNADLGFKQKIGLMAKNIMFHYYADEKIITRYKSMAGNLKKLVYQKELKRFFPMLRNAFGLAAPMLRVAIFWKRHKNRPYKFATYAPVVFNHTISSKRFYIFQTLEMIDFKKALDPQNISKLINESGLFIAHTYFSAPMSYHRGKMFKMPDAIDEQVGENFRFLGQKIRSGVIWNPTLNELVLFLANFEKTALDTDSDGNIIVANASGLPYRNIS